jgi:hypothetical protein
VSVEGLREFVFFKRSLVGASIFSFRPAGARYAVTGWTDKETRRWLDNANPCTGCGG